MSRFNARQGLSVGTTPVAAIDASGNATLGTVSGTVVTATDHFAGSGSGLSGTAPSLTAGAVTSLTSEQISTALGYTPGSNLLKGEMVSTPGGQVTAANNTALAPYLPAGLASTLTQVSGYLPQIATWTAVTYGMGLYVAVASSTNVAAYSSDQGLTWTQTNLPSPSGWNSITWNGTVFCAVSNTENKAAYSSNGTVWTQVWLPGLTSCTAITSVGSTLIATAAGQALVSTNNGASWTVSLPKLPSSSSWNPICWSPSLGLFCAVAQSSNIAATSPDGINWTQRVMPVSASWVSIAWNGSVFCAVAGYGSASTIAARG